VKATRSYQEKSGLDLLDGAIHLLRREAADLLPLYYIGSLPFVLGFLFFWADMSRNAFAADHCAAAALGLSFLFLWMKVCQSLFMDRARARLALRPAPPLSAGRLWRLVLTQTVVQPSGWLLLPPALVLTLPFAWIFAFYQHLSLSGPDEETTLRAAIRRAADQSRLWPRQNHILVLTLSLLGMVVFFNIAAGLYLLPHLLKILFGLETVFTLTWRSLVNTTFLAVVLGLTYLCLDPVVKAAFVLRTFYGEARQTGEDLRVELKRLAPAGTAARVVLVVLGLAAAGGINARAAEPPAKPGVAAEQIAPGKLKAAIDRVLERPEFAWRLPRQKTEAAETEGFNPFAIVWGWVKPILKTAVTPVIDFLKPVFQKLIDWLLRERSPPPERGERGGTDWMGWIKLLLFGLLCLSGCLLGVYVKRLLVRRRRRAETSTPAAADPADLPDLTDEQITADTRAANQWLELAREFAGRGETRQALRAVYLGILAHLAERDVIRLAGHKSNREYAAELRRRRHEDPAVLDLFSSGAALFERIWYGLHAVGPEDLDWLTDNYRQIAGRV